MFGLGPHAGFILASYLAVVVTVGGLTLWLWWSGCRQARRLAELEARGLVRGSRYGDRGGQTGERT